MTVALTLKSQLKENNVKQLASYKLSGETSPLYLREHSWFPGVVASNEVTRHQNHFIQIGEHQLVVEKKNNHPHALVWITNQHNVTLANQSGVIAFDSLSSKVISAIGAYHKQVYSRIYKYGIVSNKHQQKMKLLEITQERIACLQPLELHINQYNPMLTPQKNAENLLQTLVDTVNTISEKMDQWICDECGELFSTYDADFQSNMRKMIDKDLNAIGNYHKWLLEKVHTTEITRTWLEQTVFASYGPNSIMTHIKYCWIRQVRQAQAFNQNMTYARKSKSLLRGDFNNACEDAMAAVQDFTAHYHDPILPEHLGKFAKEDQLVAIDLTHVLHDDEALQETLRCICQIEGADQFEKDSDHYTLNNQSLLTTRWTKWRSKSSRRYTLKNIGATIANITTGVILGVCVDFPIGFVLGLFHREFPSIAEKARIKLKPEIGEDSSYRKVSSHIITHSQSLGSQFGHMLANFAKNTIWEAIKGIRSTIKETQVELFENLVDDHHFGHHPPRTKINIVNTVERELHQIQLKKQQLQQRLHDKREEEKIGLLTQVERLADPNVTPAVAPYPLNEGEFDDALNAFSRGLKIFVDAFTHHIHRKHPMTGVIFNYFYFIGGLVIYAPNTVHFMGKSYLEASTVLADAMAKSRVTSAVASAVTQASIACMAFESVIHCRQSWLARAGIAFSNNPSTGLIYSGLAIGLGYFIAYGIKIPWLSHYLKEDLGNVPISALGFAGAKIGIFLVEMLQSRRIIEPLSLSNDNAMDKLRSALRDYYRESHGLTPEQSVPEQDIERAFTVLTSDESINAISRYAKATFKDLKSHDYDKLDLLMLLSQNRSELRHLQHRTKRELMTLSTSLLSDHPDTLDAIHSSLYPQPKMSIMMRSITTVTGYLPLSIRALSSFFTKDRSAVVDLKARLKKDGTRILSALAYTTRTISSSILLMVRNGFDVLINEIGARCEGWSRKNKHDIAKQSYTTSARVDCTFEKARQTLSKPVDALKQSVTKSQSRAFEFRSQRILAHCFFKDPKSYDQFEQASSEHQFDLG